ncbi:MAG TPA: hypothetical protein VGN80_17185 [Devosiaceae bacterium]|jgi:hypothetical protein|nr:hypothetical protein [Devosiaceae bacterium]
MSSLAGSAPPRRHGFWARFAAIDDGTIIRAAFFAMLAGTAAVLFIDYRELTENAAAGFVAPNQPVLPAFDPDSPAAPPGPDVTTAPEILREPLRIALAGDGVLTLTGTFDVGSADRFAAEVAARGEYVQTVALDSPGGSVSDALAIGALLRERGYATSVAAGALCASSCPLVLAAGRTRSADPEAAIGVHQVYAQLAAGALPGGIDAAGNAMSDAQRTTALITRHLDAMGVDPALWLHALETPPDRLYYLSPEELAEYRLVTETAEP